MYNPRLRAYYCSPLHHNRRQSADGDKCPYLRQLAWRILFGALEYAAALPPRMLERRCRHRRQRVAWRQRVRACRRDHRKWSSGGGKQRCHTRYPRILFGSRLPGKGCETHSLPRLKCCFVPHPFPTFVPVVRSNCRLRFRFSRICRCGEVYVVDFQTDNISF